MDINVVMLVKLYWKVSIVFCPGATNTRHCQSDSRADRSSENGLQI